MLLKAQRIQFCCRCKNMLFIPLSRPTTFSKNGLLLFIGSDTPSWREIKDEFKEWSANNVVDPELFILASIDSARSLREASESDDDSISAIEIIEQLCRVRLLSFSGGGYISHVAKHNRISFDGVREILRPAINSFIGGELKKGSVVAAAPQGFYFAKLSGRYASHFIRTESLLTCTAAIEFLALCLLERFRAYCDGLEQPKVRILVDSMAIWPLAHTLISMRRRDDAKRRYVIESFRSYDGVSDISTESGPAFAIISASTSGGLERELFEKLGNRHVECYTILGLESKRQLTDLEIEEQRRKYLFTIPRVLTGPSSLEGLRPQFETDVSEVPPGCEAVRIIGERFLNQNFKPKSVRLSHKALDDGRKLALAQISREKLAVSSRRRPNGRSFWSLSFDTAELVKKYCVDDESGECLLRSWLGNYAVAGNMGIVHPTDILESGRPGEGEARRMAERIREILVEKAPTAEIRIVDSGQLDRPNDELRRFLQKAGIVVAAPIIGNGFVFKQISAALRVVQPKGPRLYITLAALPESQARLQELRMDLQSNSDESAYHFKSAIAVPVGKVDQDIDWYEESQLLGRVVDACREEGVAIPDSLAGRYAQLREGNGLPGNFTFLPSFKGDPLAISPGFLLWKTKDPLAGRDLGAGVLMTVAVFLESCRSGGTKDRETSLVSELFQQTLIAPANFTRFNDPAIQAALLRAAYKSELNYSSSPDLSSDMHRLILRLMQLYDAPAGEALPEFMLGLAMKRVVLVKEHMEEVLEEARKLPQWLRVLAEEIPGIRE
ncbi:hypothetical protein [Cupriavidus plantarum]|uniref:hypothetical protein n=1 Tax=Cupriavidus plantarum TaxID=942865 RepID=UPI0011C0189E|nr:hypothetical protein [Cupriavidus plantarum]